MSIGPDPLLIVLNENKRLRRLLRESLGWMENVEPRPAEPFLNEVRGAIATVEAKEGDRG